jgi:hypothetical protein
LPLLYQNVNGAPKQRKPLLDLANRQSDSGQVFYGFVGHRPLLRLTP